MEYENRFSNEGLRPNFGTRFGPVFEKGSVCDTSLASSHREEKEFSSILMDANPKDKLPLEALAEAREKELNDLFEKSSLELKKKKPCACLPDTEPKQPTIPIVKILSVLPAR